MRVKGLFFLIVGIAMFASAYLLLGGHDLNALYAALLMGIGGASVITGLVFVLGKPSRMQ
ncbi:MAG: hypothetical protein Q4D85_03030 [Corynebacterium sp.]|uniref:hypothetical protein n=1 Tax=Corynebacterium sp. TaxID=1720 RepID=UPI0026DCFC4B|nr:hypothetical protein [Corynebacterium sp.]MDO5097705.1 hypothetical protein [Corynebacterium sp.]